MRSDLQLVSLKGSTFLVSSSKQFVAIGPETVDTVFGCDLRQLGPYMENLALEGP